MPLSANRSRCFSSFRVVVVLILSASVLSTTAAPSGAAEKLRISHCYIGGAIMPLWATQDAGLFQREGLDVELISIQGQPAVAALIAGELDLLYCIPHAVISAVAGGADLVFIGSIYNRMQYRIVAAPGIEKATDLKGKIVGVARIHDVSHFYMRLGLQRVGMNPEQDIRVVAVGGQNDRVLALKSGRVAATIVNPANALVLEKSGFKTVLDLEALGFPVIGNAIAVRRNTLKDRRAVLVKFFRALMAGVKKIQGDPDFSKQVLAKYLRLKDRDVLDENYRFNSGPLLESIPAVPLQGLRYAIDSLVPTVPAVKNLKPEAMIDSSVLDEAVKGMR
jgi:ABC-type nitrate/sulfonate/bicarbonate transport system substrate-binding protein